MNNYWESRKGCDYYKRVESFINSLGSGESIVDVGAADTPLSYCGIYTHRIRIDKRKWKEIPGAFTIQADWMKLEVQATTIICCQVIEHLKDAQIKPFVDKLFSSAENVIVSVPYLWSEDANAAHEQDPIDHKKFSELMGRRDPVELSVITEPGTTMKRIVALFEGARK